MAICLKVMKPLIDDVKSVKSNQAKYWLLILLYILGNIVAVTDYLISFIAALLYKDSISNETLGIITVAIGINAGAVNEISTIVWKQMKIINLIFCFTVPISISMDKLKFKCYAFKVIYRILMFMINEATTGILLFYLWSPAISIYESMDGWKAALFIGIIYFIALLIAMNSMNHLMLIFHTVNEVSSNESQTEKNFETNTQYENNNGVERGNNL